MKPQFEKHKFSVFYGSDDYNKNFDQAFRHNQKEESVKEEETRDDGT